MKKILIAVGVLWFLLFSIKVGLGDKHSEQQTKENTINTVYEDSENNIIAEKVIYKKVEFAGCTFVIPEESETGSDGRSLNYMFDDNNSLNLDFTITKINDWDEAEKKILENTKKTEGYKYLSSSSKTIEGKQLYIVEMMKDSYYVKLCCINANNEGLFLVTYATSSPDYPYQKEIDTIISSFDSSGISDYIASLATQNENVASGEDVDTGFKTPKNAREEKGEEDKTNSTEEKKETESSREITYDDEGYIVVTYENREKLADIDKPNVHLVGKLIDTNNICFTIEDESGNLWTGESAGGLDFTEYIGTKCNIYGFCTGGISSRYDTPLVDMAYEDSHISFEDGRSYYPKDNDSFTQFPSWKFDNEKEGSGALVWIPTEGGKKYHSYEGCSGMENPQEVTESEAIRRGFEPCAKCW